MLGTPKAAHPSQCGPCNKRHLLHPLAHLHRESNRFLRHHLTPHGSAVAVLHVLHRFDIVAANLSSEHSSTNPIFAWAIRHSSQHRGRRLLCVGFLLVFLADGDPSDGGGVQLGFRPLRQCPSICSHLLCFESTEGLSWPCGVGETQLMAKRSMRRKIRNPD